MKGDVFLTDYHPLELCMVFQHWHNSVCLRQVVIYPDRILRYDTSHVADSYGILADQTLDKIRSDEYLISKEKFDWIWQIAIERAVNCPS